MEVQFLIIQGINMLSRTSVYDQSLLCAKLSNIAYLDNQSFKELGYDSVFLSEGTAQLYFLWDYNDIIIVCRGTQPERLEDIIADLEFNLTPSNSKHGEVHYGFKRSVDLLWAPLVKLLLKYGASRKIWCTGHSLGAAMATLIASRCHQYESLPNPILITFGSPRVGDSAYVQYMNSLGIVHYRWVNNADLVTRNPLFPYVHHGVLLYFDHNGDIQVMTTWQIIKDRIKGFFVGLRKGKVNFFVNHFMQNYIKNLEKL